MRPTSAGASARSLARRAASGRLSGAAVAVLCGVLIALGQVPFALVPVALIGLAGAMLMLGAAPGPRGAARAGWLIGAGYFAVTLSWIVEPFLVDIARHGWMAPFALIFMAGGLALFWAGAFAVAAGIAPDPRARVLALVGTLTLAEILRTVVLSGFPWSLVGYVWTESAAIHAAALVGPHGLTLLTLGLAGAVALLVRGGSVRHALALGLPLPLAVAAGWWQAQAPLPPRPDATVVRLVQPNAPQREKWDPRKSLEFLERQIDYTGAPGAPDLVIWPESALPYWLDQAGPELARIAEAADGATVLVGAQRIKGMRAYNSLVVLGQDGVRDIYDKHHLVPFGEFIPLGGIARWFGLQSFAAQDGYGFSSGPGPRLLDLGAAGKVLPLICYEAIFPQDVAAAPARPDWLVQVTNDAWFGTFSGPYQHLAQARVRAAERGLPLVRVANTGVSAVIDARGRVLAQIPLGEAGWIDVPLPPSAPATLYARTGDLPVIVLALLLSAGAASTRRRGTA